MTTITALSDVIHPKRRIFGNFFVVWLDENIDQSNEECQNNLTQLRSIVNDVSIFTQRDECIDFLTDVDNIKIFLIVTGNLGQEILLLTHDIPQLDAVYIICDNKAKHEQWSKKWTKVKSVHTEIMSMCESFQRVVKQCNLNTISVSFLAVTEGASNSDLNQLDSSFMYTQLYKEILLEMEYDEQSIKTFIAYCREGNYGSPSNINRFENEYKAEFAIWWYTSPTFIYSLLNDALRMMEADILISMGFFIRDLNYHVKQLHQQQIDSYQKQSFIVYRGQGLSVADFEKLQKTKGGLMSFNCFLSTSTDRDVSLDFAKSVLGKEDTIGILLEMTIDPSVSSAPFAAIQNVSYFQEEEETLFSMHTVFRIGEIQQIDNNNSLYQVKLKLTADDDQQLRTLTDHIRKETVNVTGWERLGALLVNTRYLDKAEKLYKTLLEQTPDERGKATFYHYLGSIKYRQGEYQTAISYYEKALKIRQKSLPTNHPALAISYNNIGEVYQNVGEYSKALSFCEKALEIVQKTLPPDNLSLATFYDNVGSLYVKVGEYSNALPFHEKALEIRQKNLPSNHPNLATSYSNIGSMNEKMGEYLKAHSCYEKALKIRQETLPPNHPDLATSYDHIGSVYESMGEYSKALPFYVKVLEIYQKTLPSNHPSMAAFYNNIGGVYDSMGEYSIALSFYEKAIEIIQKIVPSDHPSLATAYSNIGEVYRNMGDCSTALSFYEKAREIYQKTLPPNHPDLATSYNNIGAAYVNMGEYSEALSYFTKAREIYQITLPPNHPNLAISYNNIGMMYDNMKEYSTALSYYEKALKIYQKALPPNHPDLATCYDNIGSVYYCMAEFSKALSYYEKALEIFQKILPPNHPTLAISYANVSRLYYYKKE